MSTSATPNTAPTQPGSSGAATAGATRATAAASTTAASGAATASAGTTTADATTAAATPLQRTPLYDIHVGLGAKIVPFAGFEMPVQYPTGITAEHKSVRERCGIFDVSHMGEFVIRGSECVDFVTYVTTNDVAALEVGQAHYSTILNDRGTIEDDCLVYRMADRIMIVVNASNREKDFAHISRHLDRFDVGLDDVSEDIALIAVQGPEAERILAPLTGEVKLPDIKYYHFAEGTVAGHPCIVSRTGYTGEDGFELYHDAQHAPDIWNAIMGAGKPAMNAAGKPAMEAAGRVTPCGLGARDTLRLEAGLALYGNDIDDTITPLEARLGWLVKFEKGDFVGRDAVVRQKEQGVRRKLVGFTSTERAIPRHGYPVFYHGDAADIVRSGTMSPTLGIPIGTTYLPTDGAKEGCAFEIDVRGKRVGATVVKMPFYKRA
jgi:aminomethyltransferase